MSAPQNTIAIVYDYDQTLSPSYMQDEVVFPAFGINSEIFWRRCSELVRDHGYDNELAYMKVLLDQLGMDRPTNEELKKLGAKLNFYKGLPEMFEEFRGGEGLLTPEHAAHGIARPEPPLILFASGDVARDFRDANDLSPGVKDR